MDRQRLQPGQRRHLLRHDAMKGSNTLRVEACAFGRFYCYGNNWTRITRRADSLITSRQTSVAAALVTLADQEHENARRQPRRAFRSMSGREV